MYGLKNNSRLDNRKGFDIKMFGNLLRLYKMKKVLKSFDLICIGNSISSLTAAKHALKYNKSPCIITQTSKSHTLKGINNEDIGVRLLYNAVRIYTNSITAAEYGVWTDKHNKDSNELTFNWKVFKEKVKEQIDVANMNIERECIRLGITLIKDTAEFVSPTSVSLRSSGIVVQGEKILMAVDGVNVYDELNSLEELPKSLIVVGSDPSLISVASSMSALGVYTRVYSDTVLPEYDPQLVKLLMEHMKSKGVEFYTQVNIESITQTNNQFRVLKTKAGKELKAELIITDKGIYSCTKDLDLIAINTKLKDNIHSISSKAKGRILIDELFGYKNDKEEIVPIGVLSSPPIVRCGMNEKEAINKFGKEKVEVHFQDGYEYSQALVKSKEPMAIKFVVAEVLNKQTIIGIHALGRNTEEVVNGFALAMQKGLTKRELKRMIVSYPSIAEEFFNIL